MDERFVYKVTCLSNNKVYIGKTEKSLEERKRKHYNDARYKNDSSVFHKALRKYEHNMFIWEILCECNDSLLLNIIETMKIIVNHSHISEGGYNMTWGGDGILKGFKHTEKQNKKKSILIHK